MKVQTLLHQPTINSFLWNEFLNKRFLIGIYDECRFLCFEGPARSGKTVCAIQVFYRRVFNAKGKFHCIGGQSLDTISNNILKAANVGLMITHQNIKMVKDKIGGYHLSLIGADGKEKIILLAGYGNEARWKSILGGTIENFLLDEFNIANKTFVNETFARQLSADNPLTICCLNGDDPEHSCYQDYINFCSVVGNCPASTRKLMDDFHAKHGTKKGYYYCFFPMSANPVMTPDKLARAMSIYPVGSYYYTTKILGERGIQGDLLFRDYMTNKLLIDGFDENLCRYYRRFSIGIDIGADRARNVFVLTGWNADFTQAVVLKVVSFAACGYTEKTRRLKEFLDSILYGKLNEQERRSSSFARLHITRNNLEAIWLDCAEQNYITDLNSVIYNEYQLSVYGSYKATIKQRIDMMIIGFSTLRILFDKNNSYLGYTSYERAKKGTDKTTLREDLNEEKNDVMDAIEYSLTTHMYDLMRGDAN